MNENTSGLPGLTSTVNMKAPAIMSYFSSTKNLDSIPEIRSVLPGSLFSEWMATVMSVSVVGEVGGERSLVSVGGGGGGGRIE